MPMVKITFVSDLQMDESSVESTGAREISPCASSGTVDAGNIVVLSQVKPYVYLRRIASTLLLLPSIDFLCGPRKMIATYFVFFACGENVVVG